MPIAARGKEMFIHYGESSARQSTVRLAHKLAQCWTKIAAVFLTTLLCPLEGRSVKHEESKIRLTGEAVKRRD